MTTKSLLLILILYLSLGWVGGLYLHPDFGPLFLQFGLLWTAVGLIALLVFIAGTHLFRWWGGRRARATARSNASPKLAPAVHEDDAALAILIDEANAALEKAPGYAPTPGVKPLYGLPWYLLIGPEGSGKTSTFLNSGVEPQLLAGQMTGTSLLSATPICNLWLAKNAIFAEISGKAFSGELGRWVQLLGILRGTKPLSKWQRLRGQREQRLSLRGVIGFTDVQQFIGASADPQRFEKYCRNWKERLKSIGEVFGVEFPVYQVITKCDEIPFFRDFFRHLAESDAGQVLGSTFPLHSVEAAQPGEVFAEAEAKRLTRAFRLLYQSLAQRRLTHLAYEATPARRPAIYEFPREFKRIRSPLVQFLTDVFRPDPLRPGPLLRGYYLTAVRETEAAAENPAPSSDDWKSLDGRGGTMMFGADSFDKSIRTERPQRTARRWSFVSELFHRVVLGDRVLPAAVPVDSGADRYRRRVFAGVWVGCALLCLAFLSSWLGNISLLHDVEAAADARPLQKQGNLATVPDLRALDKLRGDVERLRNGAGWWLHWGLYSGNKIMGPARAEYFRRFRELLLNDLNHQMVNRLRILPVPPGSEDLAEPSYGILKTHLIISDGTCPVETGFIYQTLTGIQKEIGPKNEPEWQTLADGQIKFYSTELAYDNPSRVTLDVEARNRAREYLGSVNGVDKIYPGILADAEREFAKPRRLKDLASNYEQVMSGQTEVSGAFTPEGWKHVEKDSKDRKKQVLAGDPCVLGKRVETATSTTPDVGVEKSIQRRFVKEYVEQWKKFLDSFLIIDFRNAADAERKLGILAGNRSPLLALFAMTANATNVPPEEIAGLQKMGQETLKEVEKSAPGALQALSKRFEPSGTPADIAYFFQPVHSVVPPGSETWEVDKNSTYIETLAQLGRSMGDIAASSDPAALQVASQTAIQKYKAALDAVDKMAKDFKLAGLDIDVKVKELLQAPILKTKPFIEPDITKISADQINGKARTLCTNLRGMFGKYPFSQASAQDVTLSELSAFAPASGEIWTFQKQALGESTVKEGTEWKQKNPAQKPQVTQDMLRFLTRSQQVAAAFYPDGGSQPHLKYSLVPKKFPNDSSLELEIDGKWETWPVLLRREFVWPPPSGSNEVAAGIRTGTTRVTFDSYAGLWGIFRLIGNAQPRMPLASVVEWKYSRVGNGPASEIQPAPAQLDIRDFPGGQDVFTPKFFEGFQCPQKAVQ